MSCRLAGGRAPSRSLEANAAATLAATDDGIALISTPSSAERAEACDNLAFVPERHAPFAVFNRTANPVVRAVLSSPFHPLLSRKLALITVTGRRSGRHYTFPISYRQDGDRVLINVGWPERKHWWRNLRDAGRVEMRIRGRNRAGRALAMGDDRTGVTVDVQLD